ncbi:MAG: hypothetical protein WBX15_11885, partial [Thermoanaerobaculia bacterium]
MGRASSIQHTFNAGEFSPLMLGRQDIDQYAKAMYTCFNSLPFAQGGWTRRPGTEFLWPTKYSGTKTSRLIPFQYSLTQAYILEFGYQYIRFFPNHSILTATAQDITDITQASPAVVTYSGSDTYANGDRVIIQSVVGMTQVNNLEFIVANVDTGANTFELTDIGGTDVDSTGYDAYASGGTIAEIVEVTTAFAESDLVDIRVTQSADTLYIFHPDFPPQKLVRNSATSWTLSDITFLDGPYDVLNATATTLTCSAATGSGATLGASAVTGINGGSGFLSTD